LEICVFAGVPTACAVVLANARPSAPSAAAVRRYRCMTEFISVLLVS
jgi:hypothetical protein